MRPTNVTVTGGGGGHPDSGGVFVFDVGAAAKAAAGGATPAAKVTKADKTSPAGQTGQSGLLHMGEMDESLLATALDYVEADNLEGAREYLAAMRYAGLSRAAVVLQTLQVLVTGTMMQFVRDQRHIDESDTPV